MNRVGPPGGDSREKSESRAGEDLLGDGEADALTVRLRREEGREEAPRATSGAMPAPVSSTASGGPPVRRSGGGDAAVATRGLYGVLDHVQEDLFDLDAIHGWPARGSGISAGVRA